MNRDISPFFKTTVGFDRLVNELLDGPLSNNSTGYPPYNVARLVTENQSDQYEITLAVAGFTEDDITIVEENRVLKVSGKSAVLDHTDGVEVEFLHKGIAGRNFSRVFRLAEHVRVVDAKLKNGILTIRLMRETPEELKPKLIQINS